MAISCILVDDEPRAHTILRSYIAEVADMVFLGSFRNAMDAYTFMSANAVDLVFLDINMPRLDGFSLLHMLNPKPMVIMTTAHTEYAVKSYEYNAIDYLHKPIRLERFIIAVEKARKWKQVDMPRTADRSITVKASGLKQRIELADIQYIECQGNYASIVCRNRAAIKTLITVKELEELLPEQMFLRIHRSFIVNISAATKGGEDHMLIDDTSLPIGKTYKKYVEERLKK